jgi:hypothetical protein
MTGSRSAAICARNRLPGLLERGSALKIDIREAQAHIELLERRYLGLTRSGPRCA